MRTEIVKLAESRNVAVVSTDDIESTLERNKLLRTIEQKSDWGRHVATIDNVIQVMWLNEEWKRGNYIRYLSREWDELLKRKLKDPEWANLRTDAPSHVIGYGS